jgi:hypothetical protein
MECELTNIRSIRYLIDVRIPTKSSHKKKKKRETFMEESLSKKNFENISNILDIYGIQY